MYFVAVCCTCYVYKPLCILLQCVVHAMFINLLCILLQCAVHDCDVIFINLLCILLPCAVHVMFINLCVFCCSVLYM